jgi:hypothetical protein
MLLFVRYYYEDHINLFIFGLFNDTLIISNYTALNGSMRSE